MTRTLKALGASAATAGLLAVAGCSSEEEQASPAPDTAGESTGTTDTAESTAQDGGAESPASETPFDHDFATLLAGVTYKDQQVNQDTAEDVEVFKQITEAGAAEAENLGIVVDPPSAPRPPSRGRAPSTRQRSRPTRSPSAPRLSTT
ncbi:hypothetical protein [Corynebacterium timonense]|uniref:Uncharacterized protein n=1 Tax=Corynebacterium timonense TaxID=441500 RepID=A0A1H1RAV9_9CORY|nr:hypothetical protein [Corynebacterium timonense]SDS32904.1 hypothetical protein SAMN04488539_1456 [Corynebacterium timonense]